MRRTTVLGSAISLAVLLAAHAQTSERKVPNELRVAGEAALEYAWAMPAPHVRMFYDVNKMLNNPTARLRQWVADDRATVAEAAEHLKALKMPVSKVKGFDVSFALKGIRDDTATQLAASRTGLDALAAMLDAQKTSDCAGYTANFLIFDKARLEALSFATWKDIDALEGLIIRLADGHEHQDVRKVAVMPPPQNHAWRMQQLADDLAVPMRCPLLNVAFEIEVSISFLTSASPGDTLFARVRVVSGLDASQRAAVEERFSGFKVQDTSRFLSWTEVKQPMRFKWDGQIMTPVIE